MHATHATTLTPADPAGGSLDLTDADAFGRWYAENWGSAVALAFRVTGDSSLAEDIAADALVRAWQRWQVVGTPERPWAYVVTTIRNLAASHFRRADRQRRHLAQLDPEAMPSPEGGVVDREMLRTTLPLLSETERTVVALHYLDDLSSQDIAARLSVQPVTVRSYLHRARHRLAGQQVA